MRFLYFFISHSLFVACCAVGLCVETYLLLHIPVVLDVSAFVFFSTLCSYNFYWLLSKFYFKQDDIFSLKNNISTIILFLFGGIGMLYFLSKSSIHFIFVFISIFLTLLYSMPLWPFAFSKKLQQIGFAKTILLAFTWAFVTVLLPLNYTAIQSKAVLVLFALRFLFMLMLCIIFDKRDVVVDKIHGLQTLATKINATKIKLLYAVVLCIYVLLSIYFCKYSYTFGILPPLLLGAILWLGFKKSLKPQGYLFYYFFIDGLMLVSLFFNFIVQIILV